MKGFTMKTKKKKIGFTIVELLTVMAVIAMLLGILLPALNLVRKLAKDTYQRAQLHSIDVGLETYSNENDGRYPESKMLGPATPATNQMTVGSQRLAEALIGRDMLGLDPNTSWDAYADRAGDASPYASTKQPKGSSQTQVENSLKRRQGPYLDATKAEAFQVGELFTDPTTGAGDVYDGITFGPGAPAPVLTDTYRVKRVVRAGKTMMAGTPILYYKANTNSLTFPDTNDTSSILNADAEAAIYNSRDNEELITLGTVTDGSSVQHLFDELGDTLTPTGRWYFYDKITNKQITSQPRPYNSTGYILMSAGFDGIFGTRDDIYNFD
ncbi:MAG: hypothetical protein CVV39_07245 [Planctomycetes bacterium HGW-Planctomycetes-1]|nr:MAG: hypothetical protein CVV39_07245 [Planctomycetes bacterium HGW-Planctomycetes-1]